MNAKETMRLMMAFRLQEIYNALEDMADSAGDLNHKGAERALRTARERIEDAAEDLHIPELFSENRDE